MFTDTELFALVNRYRHGKSMFEVSQIMHLTVNEVVRAMESAFEKLAQEAERRERHADCPYSVAS